MVWREQLETRVGPGSERPRGLPPPPPLRHPETDIQPLQRSTSCGPIWLARATYAGAFRHGRKQVAWARRWSTEDLGLVAREKRAAGLAPERWAFVDLETTGLGTDAGTYPFLVGIGWLEEGGFVVEQFLRRDLADEPALLQAVAERLGPFAGVVTFNGKVFDLPLLATRYLLARREAPHSRHAHCDLLVAARRLWAHRTRDRRLATLESQLLGVRRAGDVPGALIPEHYASYLRHGDAALLDPVLAHNRFDLLSLLLLTAEAAGFLGRAREGAVAGRLRERRELAEDRLRAAHVLGDAGDGEGARAMLEACLQSDPSEPTRLLALGLLASQHKRRGDVAAACALWEEMRELAPQQIEPYEELAKAHEHRRRDPAQALAWVERGLDRAGIDAVDRAALEHRQRRLQRKLSRVTLWEAPRAALVGGRA